MCQFFMQQQCSVDTIQLGAKALKCMHSYSSRRLNRKREKEKAELNYTQDSNH